MIVLDENITRQSVLAGLQWCEGKVVSIKTLRPNTVIKDEAIPSLLSKQKQPTFVTTDVSGFFGRKSNRIRSFASSVFRVPITDFANSRPFSAVCFGRRGLGRKGRGWANSLWSLKQPSDFTLSVSRPSPKFRWQNSSREIWAKGAMKGCVGDGLWLQQCWRH
jgi:hypothetical protein